MKGLFFGIFILLILQSCTVQKRVHQKGHYVDWVFAKHPKKENPFEKHIETLATEKPALELILTKPDETILASTKNDEENLSARTFIFPKDTCGDQLVQKNGERIVVKIFEVNEEEIKYKRCDNIDGPTYTIKKNILSQIIYSNGVKETVVVKETSPPVVAKRVLPRPVKWAAILALVPVLNIVGIYFFPFLAVKGKRLIKAYPEKYKGLNLLKFIVALYVIGISSFLLALILFANNLVGAGALVMLAGALGIIGAAIYYAFK
jgi:hypothetical protein